MPYVGNVVLLPTDQPAQHVRTQKVERSAGHELALEITEYSIEIIICSVMWKWQGVIPNGAPLPYFVISYSNLTRKWCIPAEPNRKIKNKGTWINMHIFRPGLPGYTSALHWRQPAIQVMGNGGGPERTVERIGTAMHHVGTRSRPSRRSLNER